MILFSGSDAKGIIDFCDIIITKLDLKEDNMGNSLLASVASKFTDKIEDLATECLAHIIKTHRVAKKTFFNFISSESRAAVKPGMS